MSSNLTYKEEQKQKGERTNELLQTKAGLSKAQAQRIVSSFHGPLSYVLAKNDFGQCSQEYTREQTSGHHLHLRWKYGCDRAENRRALGGGQRGRLDARHFPRGKGACAFASSSV